MNRLVRFGAEALKPQKVGPYKWHTPRVSRRKANVLRKKAVRDGTFGSVIIDPGQCLRDEAREACGLSTGEQARCAVLCCCKHRASPPAG